MSEGDGLTVLPLTGIGEAAKSRTPLVVLAGDVPTGAVKNNFYIEQADMARAVGAVPERLHTPATAREDVLRAVSRALRERSAAPGHSWRPGRGRFRCRSDADCVSGAHRRALGDFGLRSWAVIRQPVVARHQRRLFLADRRRADRGKRLHRRFRREHDDLDHQER